MSTTSSGHHFTWEIQTNDIDGACSRHWALYVLLRTHKECPYINLIKMPNNTLALTRSDWLTCLIIKYKMDVPHERAVSTISMSVRGYKRDQNAGSGRRQEIDNERAIKQNEKMREI